jgi:lathosterol oxidase
LPLVDVAVTRGLGLTYVPIYLCGFADAALFTSLVVVSVQATFIHANVRFAFGPLKWLIATPQFHHWHHADEAQAIDKTSILDLRFATRLQSQGSWRRHVDAYSRHTSVGGGNFPCGRVRCSPAGRRDPRADGRGLRPG